MSFEAFYGLPSDVKFCTKCVISNQRPSSAIEFKTSVEEKKKVIHFDEEGVCSACRYNEVKNQNIDWEERDRTLRKLLDKYRRSDGRYDVIVPGSGGKDSSFTAHILKEKYGMNPLTVTWAPHLYTEIGWKNMQNWSHKGGLDNILYTPNGKLHQLLTKYAFTNLLHPFQPFIIGQRIIGPMMAKRFGVELVMYGENQAEYGNNVDENNSPLMDDNFYTVDNPHDMSFGGVKMKDIIASTNFTLNDFAPYLPSPSEELKKAGVAVHYLGYYLKWDPQECYYYAVDNCGFQANEFRTEGSYSKYSSIDDKIDPYHYFTTLVKFGIGRATYDAAQEIRNDKITREEGAHLVEKFDQEFPKKYFKEFLEYIDTTEEEFWKIVDKYRSPHLWGKNSDGEWKLRHTVGKNGLND